MRANITQGGSRKSGVPHNLLRNREARDQLLRRVRDDRTASPQGGHNTSVMPGWWRDRAVFFAEWGLGQSRGNLKNTSLFRVLTFSAIFGIITDGTRGHDLRNNPIRQLRA